MRILFDQVVYDMRNKGNVALLQVALNRIHGMWPDASLEVLTLSPHILKFYCPTAEPVRPDGQDEWFKKRGRYDLMHEVVPRWIWRIIFELREEIWRRRSSRTSKPTLESLSDAKNPALRDDIDTKHNHKLHNKKNYVELIVGTDLFIVTGAQHMSDAVRDNALEALDRLETAIQNDIPTAMVGQGIGPIKNADLINRARSVLPRVDMIFVRDNTSSPQLLTSLNVNPSRVCMTGDDAIEMAYQARTESLGNGIGISWRSAPYTELNNRHLQVVKMAIKKAVEKYQARLIALPISHSAHELDDQFIRQLVTGYPNSSNQWLRFDSPVDIVKNISNCRLVVAGTFHAVVFALAQGIPAIGLAKSEMYMDKFLGLVDQFGPGIQIIYLDDDKLQDKLGNAIDTAWTSAERIRPKLLESAKTQIQLGQTAYRKLYELVESRNAGECN
jgi:polysaccharide pyruvyl transferase WcaK-like protein